MKNLFILIHNKLHISLLFISLVGLLTIIPSVAMADEFPDTINSWARIDIANLKNIGVCSGYADGTFNPDHSIKRAEFTKLLVTAMGYDQEATRLINGTSNFSDVGFDYWAKPYILIASDMKLVYGYNSLFDPEAPITREEAITILSRVQQLNNKSDLQVGNSFTDSKEISDWAKDFVNQAYAGQLITGFPDGSFRPKGLLNRAETVTLLTKIMDKLGILYQFNGVVSSAGNETVKIKLGSHSKDFVIADEAILVDNNRILTTLNDIINTRISFNLNTRGEIVWARLSYEDKYVNLEVAYQEDLLLQSSKPAQSYPMVVYKPVTTQSLGSEMVPLPYDNPAQTLENTKQIAGINQLSWETGLSGQGVTIAVIDSGIDTLHPDLQRTSINSRKIVDWVNLTGEGMVSLPFTGTVINGDILMTQGGYVTLPQSRSASGLYHYGFWAEDWIIYAQSADFTGNGLNDDKIMVLLVDPWVAGQYDVVYVDTNHNLSLADESPLYIYRDNKYNYGSFPPTKNMPRGFPFILADIADDAESVLFGYDSLGHGTHVAGIIGANGVITGAAPNASLMAIKVVDSSGITTAYNIKEGVKYALEHGADVINISLGQYFQNENDTDNLRAAINSLAGNKAVFVVSSGNGGPGIASLATPGDIDNVISVGAYISPDMWQMEYGMQLPAEGVLYFNSTGPGKDGTWKPDIIAPGSVVSSYPSWTGEKYRLDDGTSMAAPFVTGISALLLEGMWNDGNTTNSQTVKEALGAGARSLEQLSLIEQGHGLVNAVASWDHIQTNGVFMETERLVVESTLNGEGSGIYARELIPGVNTVKVSNNGADSILINWESKADWLEIGPAQTLVAPDSDRSLDIIYNLPDKPGLYSGLVEGTIANKPYQKIEFLSTVVLPIELDSRNYSDYAALEAGQMKRYYFEVPDKAEKLSLKLKILGTIDKLQGRARIHIYNPWGIEYEVSDYAGIAPSASGYQREVEVSINRPNKGIYEVVVYSSANLGQFNLSKSDYVLSAELAAPRSGSVKHIENDWIIGCAYPILEANPETIWLNIWDGNYKPYNGKLLINNRLYEVVDGKVEIIGGINYNSLSLIIRKVISDRFIL